MNKMWKLPPKIKILEALGCVADDRVSLTKHGALVMSSDGSKSYTVTFVEDSMEITANDNGSYWQGYTGYPIIAFLMVKGVIAYDKKVSESLSHIPWKKLNTQYKNDYDLVIDKILHDLEKAGVNTQLVLHCVENVEMQLELLQLKKLKSSITPPSEKKK